MELGVQRIAVQRIAVLAAPTLHPYLHGRSCTAATPARRQPPTTVTHCTSLLLKAANRPAGPVQGASRGRHSRRNSFQGQQLRPGGPGEANWPQPLSNTEKPAGKCCCALLELIWAELGWQAVEPPPCIGVEQRQRQRHRPPATRQPPPAAHLPQNSCSHIAACPPLLHSAALRDPRPTDGPALLLLPLPHACLPPRLPAPCWLQAPRGGECLLPSLTQPDAPTRGAARGAPDGPWRGQPRTPPRPAGRGRHSCQPCEPGSLGLDNAAVTGRAACGHGSSSQLSGPGWLPALALL